MIARADQSLKNLRLLSIARADQSLKNLRLLSEHFPTQQSVFTEIINLQAILNLPKGTELFMSDLHGEYEAFLHILNNSSGVVREHVDDIFGDELSEEEKGDLCTLIYYPHEKLALAHLQHIATPSWYKVMLERLLVVHRDHKLAGNPQPAQGHRAFHERPAR